MNIEEVHKINLLMLKKVDEICKKNNIKYRLEAGTLLGAIRHKGFIPWDDDCDIVFKRSEYDKFLAYIKKAYGNEGEECINLKDDIKFVPHKHYSTHFHDFVDRLYYTGKVYRDEERYKDRFDGDFRYLWLDIFVLDYVPVKKMKQVFFLQKLIYGLSMGHRYYIDYSKYKNVVEKMEAFALSTVGKFIPLTIIREWQERLSKKYNATIYEKENRKLYFSNYPPVFMYYVSSDDVEDNLIDADFCDTKLPVVKDYDAMLTYYYGDYMTYPPKERQVPEHKDIFIK